ncbi:enoyl-CoA-hydratase DpgB [Actinoplanes sp. NPDC026619]|uniref:enoyl-CoA-hydratase DpgB n=1 Tax=Actinoplanes sp. NPDC026619 TaxID=3155798 RepID=UPI00340C0083
MVTADGTSMLRIDGGRPVTVADVEAVLRACDRAEDGPPTGMLVVHVSGAPAPGWAPGLTVGLVTKWERAVRRLERLPLATIAMAAGDCGGTALDVLLATDVRVAEPDTRLVPATDDEAIWPGMALYRLSRQGGAGVLRRAALLSIPIGAAEARALGLLDVVTEEPETALADLRERTAAVSGPELAIRRQLLLDADRTSFEEALGSHLAACDRALRRAAR